MTILEIYDDIMKRFLRRLDEIKGITDEEKSKKMAKYILPGNSINITDFNKFLTRKKLPNVKVESGRIVLVLT
jgi:hypothetical protein